MSEEHVNGALLFWPWATDNCYIFISSAYLFSLFAPCCIRVPRRTYFSTFLKEKVFREGIKAHSLILDSVYCFLSIQTCNPFIKRDNFALRGFVVDKSILTLPRFLLFFHMLTKILCFPGFFFYLKVSWLTDKSQISLYLPFLEMEYIWPFPSFWWLFTLCDFPKLTQVGLTWLLPDSFAASWDKIHQAQAAWELWSSLSVLVPPCAFPRGDATTLLLLLALASLCICSLLSEMQKTTRSSLACLAFYADDFHFSSASESIICLVSLPLSLHVYSEFFHVTPDITCKILFHTFTFKIWPLHTHAVLWYLSQEPHLVAAFCRHLLCV